MTDLLVALLAKDPTDRPTGAKVLAWLSWLQVVTPPAGPPDAGTHRRFSQPPPPAPVERPTRPLLPPAPPVPRRAGRRLAGVVALLLLGGMVAAWLTGTFGADPTRERAAAPATTGPSAGIGPGQEQAGPASTRGRAAVTGTTRTAPPTTREPATTRAPTTPTTAAQGRLPGGWRTFTNRAGNNRVGVPPGFLARTRPTYNATVVEEQGGGRRVFTVRSQNPSALLPQASRDYRAWARRNFDGYREVRYAENQTYAGRPGAVVFEYEAVRDGRRVHVSHVNVKGRSWGYNVELIVPVGQWAASQALARRFEQAFSPLG